LNFIYLEPSVNTYCCNGHSNTINKDAVKHNKVITSLKLMHNIHHMILSTYKLSELQAVLKMQNGSHDTPGGRNWGHVNK